MLVLGQECFKVEEIAWVVDERRIVAFLLELWIPHAFIIVSKQVDEEAKEALADLSDVIFI